MSAGLHYHLELNSYSSFIQIVGRIQFLGCRTEVFVFLCQLQIGTYQSLPRTEQQRHLPSASMETERHAAIALTFNNPQGSSGWGEAPCAPGNLVGQVFREWDVFRSRFHDLKPCSSSYLEKH